MTDDRFHRLIRHAELIHRTQVDKSGAPYVDHLLAVASTVRTHPPINGIDPRVVGLFHDSMEDHGLTEHELAMIGLTAGEITAVEMLTHDPQVPYRDYIAMLTVAPGDAGEAARRAKVADLGHNLGRMTDAIRADSPQLEKRYTEALRQLQ